MEYLENIYVHFTKSEGVFTDTRSPKKGGLFFALKGPNFDGNNFVEEALEKGAYKAIVSDTKWAAHPDCIYQENTLVCLQQLATHHRLYFKGLVLAITGSNGKTTSKELFKNVLASQGTTFATQGNLNNHIGVPLSILQMPTEADYYIIEMGANHRGEIAALCDIAAPDWGYITNFGSAHLEGFGSKEGIIKGKTELYTYLKKNAKQILFNADDPIQLKHLNHHTNKVSFGSTLTSDYQIKVKNSTAPISLQFKDTLFTSSLYGAYNIPNITAAIAFGLHQQLSPENIQKGLDNYAPSENRSQLLKTAKNLLVLDAYNANPNSMQAAITAFAKQEGENKVVILGDMMELGNYSKAAHQEIITLVNEQNFNAVLLVGKQFEDTKAFAKNTRVFSTTAACKLWLEKKPLLGKHILLKGSRSMALETLQSVL